MATVTGYTPEQLEEADREFEDRKHMREKIARKGGYCGFGLGLGVGYCIEEAAVAPIIHSSVPHVVAGLGIGAAAGCIAGYGCYKLIKPQNSQQLLRIPDNPPGVEMTAMPAIGSPVTDDVVAGVPRVFVAEAPVQQNPMYRGMTPPVGQTMNPVYEGEEVVPSFKKGGLIKRTGLAYVHKGEYVVPVKDVKKCNVCSKR